MRGVDHTLNSSVSISQIQAIGFTRRRMLGSGQSDGGDSIDKELEVRKTHLCSSQFSDDWS